MPLPHCSSKSASSKTSPQCKCSRVCPSIPIYSAMINLAQSWIANTKMQKMISVSACEIISLEQPKSSSLSFVSKTMGGQLGADDVFVCRFTSFLFFFLTLGVDFVTSLVSSYETSWLERLYESSSTSCGETGSLCEVLNSI